jgi:hypothetical protein
LEIDAAMCPCCKDWQKVFEQVKLMHILQDTDVEWRGRILVSKLFKEQSKTGRKGNNMFEERKKGQTKMMVH